MDPKRVEIWEKYNKRCAYCGHPLEYKDMQIDHIHPRANGGLNRKSNFNPSCRACNFYKSTYTLNMFRKQLQALKGRLERIFIFKLAIKFGLIRLGRWDGVFYFEKCLNKSKDGERSSLDNVNNKHNEEPKV